MSVTRWAHGRAHRAYRVRSSSRTPYLILFPIFWCNGFVSQALELAAFIQSQKDLDCQASQVVHLEEGLNSDSPEAADFWNLLGGRTDYRG